MATEIHPTAVIDKDAQVEDGATVGPFCVIGKGVTIGKGSTLMSHVVVDRNTVIGENCQVGAFSTLGFPPQDLKYKGEDTWLKIGNNTIIREYVSVHRGSVGGDGSTEIGDNSFLMDYVHIAHDCKVGSHIIMANSVGLSGHVTIGDHAVLGGMVGIHQFVRIGAYSMTGGFSRVSQDISPYMIAAGAEKLKLFGLNVVGLKRKGFSEETVEELKKAYRILFRQGLSLNEAVKQVQAELPYTDEIRHLIEFIQANKRGICR